MYASLWMLLRPFGAMNGFWADVLDRTACATPVDPVYCGTAALLGSLGIGSGGEPGV